MNFPKIVPEVYQTSDGKLHADKEKAFNHQELLDFKIPFKNVMDRYHHTLHRYHENDIGNPDMLLSILKEAGFKIVKE